MGSKELPIIDRSDQETKCEMQEPIVIAGGGPVGTRAAQELSKRGFNVVLLNAERWKPYNRVKLTPLLAGEANLEQIYASDYFPRPGKVARYDSVSVVDVDRDGQRVLLSNGRVQDYSKLILAIGSRAFVPKISGIELDGVYVFRDFNDTESLIARSVSARRVAVIGGGLLGLEAARGMMKRGAAVTVIEHENRLMPRQLDIEAGASLKARILSIGIEVLTSKRVEAIEGNSRVERVRLSGDQVRDFDTVIICTGVRANTQLPAGIGLVHNRGIDVNANMQTSDPNIYAIGECAEFDEIVYGLVGPGYEQASIAAKHIAAEDTPAYEGSTPATKLKVLGADIFSIGDFESIEQQPGIKSYIYQVEEKDLYRRIFVNRGRLVAALGVGEWPEATKLQQAASKKQRIFPWQALRFKLKGDVWKDSNDGVAAWPKEAIVCNCTGVNKGAILDCMTLGATTLEDVRTATSANTVCGTCKPIVQELLGNGTAKPEPAKWWKALLIFSFIAIIGAVATAFLPRIPISDTFIKDDFLTNIWFDSIWKQYSGYTLLGLTVAAALLGLRKRIKLTRFLGGYDGWRIVHLVIGIACALVLVWHTGFRLGDNINFYLMLSFLFTLIFGAIAGLITGGEHDLQERGITNAASKPRTIPLWIHILALWPMPALLVIHILSVYAY